MWNVLGQVQNTYGVTSISRNHEDHNDALKRTLSSSPEFFVVYSEAGPPLEQ